MKCIQFEQFGPGEGVFIRAANCGVGRASVQWAKARGLRVIGTAGTAAGLEMVRRQGAEQALAHRTPGYLEEARRLSGGGRALLLEMLAAIVAGPFAGCLNPMGGRELPLAQAARAHEAVLEPGALGKIVLLPE